MNNCINCWNCPSRCLGVFNACTESEITEIDKAKNCSSYKGGQKIYEQHHKAYGVYCILEGKVKISQMGGEGREHILSLAKQGDVLGFREIMTNKPFSTTATALADSRVCFIPVDIFKQIVDRSSHLSYELSSHLSKSKEEAENHILTLALKPVRERLADALLLLKEFFGEDQQGSFTINISRQNLADLVGTVKETVIRTLSEFKDEGLIETRGSEIVILSPKGIRAISEMYN